MTDRIVKWKETAMDTNSEKTSSNFVHGVFEVPDRDDLVEVDVELTHAERCGALGNEPYRAGERGLAFWRAPEPCQVVDVRCLDARAGAWTIESLVIDCGERGLMDMVFGSGGIDATTYAPDAPCRGVRFPTARAGSAVLIMFHRDARCQVLGRLPFRVELTVRRKRLPDDSPRPRPGERR